MHRVCLALALIALLPAAAHAEYFPENRQPASSSPVETWGYVNEPNVHDRGFFLRTTLGPGWFSTRMREPDARFTYERFRIEGAGLELGVAAGGIVAPNLAIHATATSLVSFAPRVHAGSLSRAVDSPGVVLLGVGPGITGFTPGNAYASVSFGGLVAAFDFDAPTVVEPDTGYGFFFDLTFGKEWWTAPRTGVGIFGRVTGHRYGTDYPEPFGGVTLSTGLSFTFN